VVEVDWYAFHTRVTIKDVAKRAGLSPSTVSRALNRSGYVSAQAQRQVDQAISELGYQPNWMARSLRGKPSGTIGLIIPDILNVFYTALARSVSATLRAPGYALILCVSNEDPEIDHEYLETLWEKRVDGIIYAHPAVGHNSPFVRELAKRGMPMVELNRQREKDILDAVLADNFQGAYQMTEYLIQRGHCRIGLIVGELALTTGKDRLAGYRRALEDAGIPLDSNLIRTGTFTREYGEKATYELLQLAEPPTALFAGSNRILAGALFALQKQGRCVPGDISVVAFDDAEWLSVTNPPITVVDIATDEMARLAIDLLLRRIAYPQREGKPVTYVLSTSLIERESCQDLTKASHIRR
jgi:DNA-binding LacI/PurR family transcriptional regulator